jgi:hypothetical protein
MERLRRGVISSIDVARFGECCAMERSQQIAQHSLVGGHHIDPALDPITLLAEFEKESEEIEKPVWPRDATSRRLGTA